MVFPPPDQVNGSHKSGLSFFTLPTSGPTFYAFMKSMVEADQQEAGQGLQDKAIVRSQTV